MKLLQVLSLGITLTLLVSGAGFGGYVLSKRISSVPCYGCMGLNPEFIPFKGFSTEDVSHPEWVVDTLKNGKIVFIFFCWYHGCPSCDEQWVDMEVSGIVKGDKWDGAAGDKYKDNVKLFSLDTKETEDNQEALNIYSNAGGVPTTVVITLVRDNETDEVKIGWYFFMGYQPGKPTMSNLEHIIESAIYHYDENRSQWET
ncbi:MAG: hypothetical protein QMC80_01495 [Thermoplasmatales archaeon]|nr:hypothetical protein [Thermoplasmatales archaeon]